MQRRLSSQHIAEKAEEAQKLIELDGDFLMAKAKEVGSQTGLSSRVMVQLAVAHKNSRTSLIALNPKVCKNN